MAIRAVLFDVGGPINTEIEHERLIDADIFAAVEAAGIAVSKEQYVEAVAFAVHSYAPDAHPAIIWHLVQGDEALGARVFSDFRRRVDGRNAFELREGIAGVISSLYERGVKLGLAANQPQSASDVAV